MTLRLPTLLPELPGLPETWHVPRELLAVRGIRHEPKLCYLLLWQLAGRRTRRLRVDYMVLAATLGGSERGVRRWLATLDGAGLVSIDRREPRLAELTVRDWRRVSEAPPTARPRRGQQLELPGLAGDDDGAPTTIAMWGTDVARRRHARRTHGPDRPDAG